MDIFRNNSFTAVGALSNNASGQLIAGDQVTITPNNSGELVFLSFQGCQFDPRMVSVPSFGAADSSHSRVVSHL